jgi:dethiobiotin synthetase/adenosylmethionine--8-amino-7-oxononanoate aminotransferase
MTLAIAEAAGRYGHVLAPTNLHLPVVQLTRYLLEEGPGQGWAARVFYSDDGSTGMEVAIKMAFRLYTRREKLNKNLGEDISAKKLIVISQCDSYHGDTLGTMLTAEPNIYNNDQHNWYKPHAVCIPLPLVAYRKGILSIDVSALKEKVRGRLFCLS